MTDDDRPGGGNILITGPPGVGKTTVIIGLTERLAGRSVAGFYTEEVRENGQRCGFRIMTVSGKSGVLADRRLRSRTHVGRYGVDVAGFEEIVVPELSRQAELIVIDEIGKMECFSRAFVDAVRRLLDGSLPVVATVAASGGGFMAEVKSRTDIEVWTVSGDNRDTMPERLAAALGVRGAKP